MRLLFSFFLFFFCCISLAHTESELRKEIKAFHEKLDMDYKDKKKSPLPKKARKKFSGHTFFPVDLDYVVWANFERISSEDTMFMRTSSDRIKAYKKYAKIHFVIKGEEASLTVYQSYRLRQTEEYKDYLFIPFKDVTSGEESYGGGRYMDVKIPKDGVDSIQINFHKAYNPYCAYTEGYNCPIPPVENTLRIPIKAGLKTPKSAYSH